MLRQLKTKAKKSLRTFFELSQKLNLTILPYHFYSQIPNIAQLKKDDYWQKANTMYSVEGSDIEKQVIHFEEIAQANKDIDFSKANVHQKAIAANGEDSGYGVIEADVLYSFIRKNQPQKIIQIGCGVSTALILQVVAELENYNPTIVCVEPYPMPFLVELEKQNKVQLIKEFAQKVDLNVLTDLKANDFFFVDSTHTVKVGSEVNRIILEVLPRLVPSTWIHFHDIYFPYDYKRDILTDDLFFWSESTLLHSFLVQNSACQIWFSMSMLHYSKPSLIKKYLPHYTPQENINGLRKGTVAGHFPSSIFLKTR